MSARRVRLSPTRASELYVGGIASLMSLADQLKMPASTGGALMMALQGGLPCLTPKGIATAYRKLGGELSPEADALLQKTLAKPKRRARS